MRTGHQLATMIVICLSTALKYPPLGISGAAENQSSETADGEGRRSIQEVASRPDGAKTVTAEFGNSSSRPSQPSHRRDRHTVALVPVRTSVPPPANVNLPLGVNVVSVCGSVLGSIHRSTPKNRRLENGALDWDRSRRLGLSRAAMATTPSVASPEDRMFSSRMAQFPPRMVGRTHPSAGAAGTTDRSGRTVNGHTRLGQLGTLFWT